MIAEWLCAEALMQFFGYNQKLFEPWTGGVVSGLKDFYASCEEVLV